MSSSDVEFRLLYLIVNSISEERRAVGLIHWTAGHLRAAWKPTAFGWLGAASADLRAALQVALRPAVRAMRRSKNALPLGLDASVGVVEGAGGMLEWGPLRRASTSHPLEHFQFIMRELGLRELTRAHLAEREPRIVRLDMRLVEAGRRIRDVVSEPQRVEIQKSVRALREYTSPLSWKNGVWHHSVPVNCTEVKDSDVADRFERALGLIDTSIPDSDVSIICVAVRASKPMFSELLRVQQFLTNRFHGQVDLVVTPTNGEKISFDDLETRVRRDIDSSAAKS